MAAALVLIGTVLDALVVGLALTTTALGTLLPILRDAGLLEGRFGSRMMAIGSVGEFGPILAVAVLLDHRDPVQTALLLLALRGRCGGGRRGGRPVRHPPKVVALLHRHLQSSAQLPIRIVGAVDPRLWCIWPSGSGSTCCSGPSRPGSWSGWWSVARTARSSGESWRPSASASSSRSSSSSAACSSTCTPWSPTRAPVLRVPLFLVLFLVVRGTPALLLYRSDLPRRELFPLALFSATGLPLIVVITTIGVSEGRMLPVNAAALVAAGMLSVLVYPMTAKVRLRRAARAPVVPVNDHRIAGDPVRPPLGIHPQLSQMSASDGEAGYGENAASSESPISKGLIDPQQSS